MKKRGFAKTAPKSLERRIIDNALLLKKDFSHILPEPIDNRSKRVIENLRRRLEKVWKVKDDIRKLERLSKKRGMEGALAAALILANNPKAPYLAQIRVGNKTVAYAVRGRADKEKLITVQYFDDPILRLLGYRDIAPKKKLAFYSWNSKFICSSADSPVPVDFVSFLSDHLDLEREKDKLKCPHLGEQKESLFIKIKNLEIEICKNCLGERNTFIEVTKYFVDPLLDRNVSIEIKSPLSKYGVEISYVRDYLSGKIGDNIFFQRNIEKWRKELSSKGIFLIYWDGEVFDRDDFLSKIDADEDEKKALKVLFDLLEEPVFVENPSPNAILKTYWKNFGKEILAKLSGDEKLSRAVFNLEEPPIKQIRDIKDFIEKSAKISRYPAIQNPSPVMEFIDNIVKEYILHGKEKVLTMLSRLPQDTRKRSIAYAFLLALGKGEERKWQYRKEEIEFGEFLREYAERLLKAEPEEYVERLKELLTAAGAE